MTTRGGSSSPATSRHQIWRPGPQAAEYDAQEKEADRKFDEAKTSGPQPYKPWSGGSGPRVPPVSKTASTGKPKQSSSTSTRRSTDTAPEAAHGLQHVSPSSTKASSAGTNSGAQRPASERTSSNTRDSQSTTRTTTARTDSSSNSPRSTSIPSRRTEPTPPRTQSTDKEGRSQKATVESDGDEDVTDSDVEKASKRPPASTTHMPVSSKAVVDDSSSSEQKKEEPMLQEREHRPYSQPYVNERITLRPPGNTTPTSDDTQSTRQEMEFNNGKPTPEVQAQRESFRQMQEDELRRKNEAAEQRERERRELEERQKREAAEQRERERVKEEERRRAEAHARELWEQREREKKQEQYARREEEAKSRYKERKRAEDAEKERERSRRATWDNSSSRTSYSSAGGTSAFPGSPPPFGSFGSGFPASPASFSSAGSASTQNVAAAWEQYDKAWTALPEKAKQAPLRWRDIPWPMVAQPSKSGDLVNDAIANFILSPTHSQSKSPKERIREALLKWHPDQFGGRWLSKCAEKDHEEIKTGVGVVVRCLKDLMSVQGAFGSPP